MYMYIYIYPIFWDVWIIRECDRKDNVRYALPRPYSYPQYSIDAINVLQWVYAYIHYWVSTSVFNAQWLCLHLFMLKPLYHQCIAGHVNLFRYIHLQTVQQ